MFDTILAFAERGAVISPWLPFIIKTAVFLTISVITLIPVMFTAWLVNWASSPAVRRGVVKLDGLAVKASSLARDVFENGSEKLRLLATNSALYIPLEYPNETHRPVDLIGLESSIERLRHKIDRAPDLAANTEAVKQKTLDSLVQSLELLSKERGIVRIPQIPKISETDANAKLRKNQARTALLLFTPLTLAVIAINTVLLNVFFDSFFDGQEVFGVPYAIVIAIIFSIMEAGIGAVLGLMASSEQKLKSYATTAAVCYIVIACLMFIEVYLYFFIGTFTFGELEQEQVVEYLMAGSYLELFVGGGWISPLGAAIVLSLYLFGHKLSIAYFDFSKYSNFDAFRKTLDDGHKMSESFSENVQEGERRVLELMVTIRDEDISLNNIKSELPAKVEGYRKSLIEQLSEFDKSIATARDLEIEIPEIQAQKIGPDQSEELLKVSVIYLVLFIVSIVIGAWAFPTNNIPFLPDHGLAALLLSTFVALVCLIGGLMFHPRVSVVSINEGHVGRVVIDKRGWLGALGVTLVALGLTAFYWYVFKGIGFSEMRASTAVVCNVACFFVGMRLLSSLPGWSGLARWLVLFVVGSFFRLCQLAATSISFVLDFIDEILGMLAMPVRTTFGRQT